MSIAGELQNPEVLIGGEPVKVSFVRFKLDLRTSATCDITTNWSDPATAAPLENINAIIASVRERSNPWTWIPVNPRVVQIIRRVHRRIGRVNRRRKNRSRH